MLVRQQFKDRREAGQALAEELRRRRSGKRSDLLVLALPRGGVPVAYEVARELKAPLDVFIVRKLGVPGQEELAMGAIGPAGVLVLNEGVVQSLGISKREIDNVARVEQAELERRQREYRGNRPMRPMRGKTVILIDDGLATGSSMRAAAMAVRELSPAEIVVAVPVAAAETCEEFRAEVDEVVCPLTPEPFRAVGLWYDDFSQTSDREVRELLNQAWEKEDLRRGDSGGLNRWR